MQTVTAKKLMPVEGDEQRIDISLENGQTVLKLSTWVDGLGWCCQKTMKIEAALLDDLHRAVATARCKVRQEAGAPVQGKVIDFPVFS